MRHRTIILEDNHESRELSDDEASKLLRFAGCGLKKLCSDNPSLLLFPDCLGDNGDDIEAPLYSIVGKKLWTGNVVGFWGVDGVNVRVHSRFDDDGRQYFFHYMLQRIAGVNVFDLKTLPDANNNIWDFLIYLFPMALKSAVRQGIFRTYRVSRYNDDRIKGAIDVPRFIRRDVPFAGKIAYATREHTANNHVLQLVRHTIEFIRRTMPVLLSVDSEMRQAVEMVVQVTPDYANRSRGRVIAANLRPVRHPFYSAYTGLQKLCLQILRHEKLSFGESDGSICGVVFDAAWLWEEYLNAVFMSDPRWSGMVHPRNKQRTAPVYFYANHRQPHYPDFHDQLHKLVLDAKYKFDNGIERSDLLQMVSYVHILEYRAGVFLKPDPNETVYREDGTLATSRCETIGVVKLKIPKVNMVEGYMDFSRLLFDEEQLFLKEVMRCVKEANNGDRRD